VVARLQHSDPKITVAIPLSNSNRPLPVSLPHPADRRSERLPQRAIRQPPVVKAALLSLGEILYPVSMSEPWNPVIVGVSCAAGVTAIVAACKTIGVEAPLTYGTAVVGGMFWGGLIAILTNVFSSKR
jgi:hypothetical protein